jgi:ankyrin repeat protein
MCIRRLIVTALLLTGVSCAGTGALQNGTYEDAKRAAERTSRSLLQDTRLRERPLSHVVRNPQLSAAERTEILKILLDRGALVDALDARGDTSLIWAARVGHVAAARVLLDAGARIDMVNRDGESPFSLALTRADVEMAQLLVERGAARDTRNNENESPLFVAAKEGNAEEVDRLIALGSPLEIRGHTALMGAALGGHLDLARRLVEAHGARVETTNGFGETAATYAAESGSLEFIDYLIAHGETCRSGGRTPLMAAAAAGHVAIVDRLLVEGVEPGQVSPGQVPALAQAAVRRHEAIACRLVDAGSPLEVEVEDAQLRAAGHETIADCLVDASRIDEAIEHLEGAALGYDESAYEFAALADEHQTKIRIERLKVYLEFGLIGLAIMGQEWATSVQARQLAQLQALQYMSEHGLGPEAYSAAYDPGRVMGPSPGWGVAMGQGINSPRPFHRLPEHLVYAEIVREAHKMEAAMAERARTLRARAAALRGSRPQGTEGVRPARTSSTICWRNSAG